MATLTVTPTQTFISGDTVLPATLNQLAQSTVALTAGTIVDADISASAAIAASKLAATLDLSSKTVTLPATIALPAGAVMPFAMNSAPAGWLAADGAAVNRVGTYAALFAAIGTTHGVGNGSTTFNLPDLRGIFVRGWGQQTVSGTLHSSADFAQKQDDAFASHNHTVTDTDVANNGTFGAGGLAAYPQGVTTRTTSTVGGTETRPANIALLYCIKF